MSRVYDVDVDIQVQEGDVKGGTLGTLGTHVGLTEYLSNAGTSTDNVENRRENNGNIVNPSSNTDKSTSHNTVDEYTLPNNVSHASHVSQTPETSTNRYQSGESNSKTMSPNVSHSLSQEATGLDPPDLARTSQFLKNLQEAERARARKSKVAQAAGANTSGRSVMDDGAAAADPTA